MIGRIRNYDPDRAFGHVWTEAGIFFFPESALITEIERNDVCEFWLDDNLRGPGWVAVDVKRIEVEQPVLRWPPEAVQKQREGLDDITNRSGHPTSNRSDRI